MANEGIAVMLLLAIFVAGGALMINIVPEFLVGGSIAFSSINSPFNGFWIIVLRLIVAPLMMISSAFVIFNIIKG